MIEDIISKYEAELKCMIHSKFPEKLVIPQFFNYQKTLRDYQAKGLVRNDYDFLFKLFKDYVVKK
jgi:hypothetical protein